MQREQVQLQGIDFPETVRQEGASVELFRLESPSFKDIEAWIVDNHFDTDRQFGFVSEANNKQEIMLLWLSFRRVIRTRYRVTAGRLSKLQEESTEPEIGELHFRRDGLLEMYAMSPKQRNLILNSLDESFRESSVKRLSLSKSAMISLMKEAVEVSSVSLSGLGNPFFSDMTLSGEDPVGSRTFKEILASGSIKSFRGRFQIESGRDEISRNDMNYLLVTVHNKCKVRFHVGGENVVAQSSLEDFLNKVGELSTIETEVEK